MFWCNFFYVPMLKMRLQCQIRRVLGLFYLRCRRMMVRVWVPELCFESVVDECGSQVHDLECLTNITKLMSKIRTEEILKRWNRSSFWGETKNLYENFSPCDLLMGFLDLLMGCSWLIKSKQNEKKQNGAKTLRYVNVSTLKLVILVYQNLEQEVHLIWRDQVLDANGEILPARTKGYEFSSDYNFTSCEICDLPSVKR